MGDTDLLTEPVAKGKSLWKMLTKQVKREQREGLAGPRGVPRGGADHLPETSRAAASALGGARGPSQLRRSMDNLEDIELPDLRHRDKRQADCEDDQGGVRGQGYSKDTSDYRINPPTSHIASSNPSIGRLATDHRAPAHPEPTHSDPMLTPSNDNTRPKLHVDTTNSQSFTVQSAQDNWRITPDTYFVYGPSFRPGRQPPKPKTKTPCEWWDDMWSPYGGFHRLTSVYIYVSLSLLFVANVLFLVAFVTNNWGVLHIERPVAPPLVTAGGDIARDSQLYHVTPASPVARTNESSVVRWVKDTWRGISGGIAEELGYGGGSGSPEEPAQGVVPPGHSQHVVNMMERKHKEPEEYWEFGLWQCCRNTDGLCLGPRWAAFYQGVRVFAVLALFGMVLTFAWMLGHTLEKLLDYDVCTMSCLISLCYISAFFILLAVVTFGARWPKVFATEFDGTSPHLSFSFYMAATSFPLTLTAAILSTIDLTKEVEKMKAREQYFSEAELNDIDPIIDLPTDNISRPREYKKKRTGFNLPNAKYTSTETYA